jgi:hypothetical protein
MLSLVIPDSFTESCFAHGLDRDATNDLAQEYLIVFGEYPRSYGEALGALE